MERKAPTKDSEQGMPGSDEEMGIGDQEIRNC
jgi:hypothetical protein